MLGRFTHSPTLAFILAFVWTPAFAGEAVEEIVVTGSYISGTPLDAPFPVQVLDRAEIVASGVSDMGELIRNLEVNSGSYTTPDVPGNGSSDGAANVNLRGLGLAATLVLLNSKRMPTSGDKAANGDRFVDINTIPITMIDRVEVLKDGGSAIYGSDAIAGVANFITRNDFNGFEFRGNIQRTTDGNSQDRVLGAIFGRDFNDGRTHLVLGLDWLDRTDMDSAERPKLRQAYPKQASGAGQNVNRTSVVNFFPNGTDPQCEALGYSPNNSVGSDPQLCAFNGSLVSSLIPNQERKSAMLVFSHEFTDWMEFYGTANLSDKESSTENGVWVGPIEPKFYLGTVNVTSATLPCFISPLCDPAVVGNHPGLISNGGPIPDAFASSAASLIDFSLRVPGNSTPRKDLVGNESSLQHYVSGLRGNLPMFETWRYDASVTYGKSNASTYFTEIRKNNLELATYGFGGPDCVPDMALAGTALEPLALGVGQGLIDSLDAAGITTGIPGLPYLNVDNIWTAMLSTNDGMDDCHFYNPYLNQFTGGTANSEELLRWMEAPIQGSHNTDQETMVLDLVLTGDLFEMPAGKLQGAFGMQYRWEQRDTAIDPIHIGEVNSRGELAAFASVAALSENANFNEDRDAWGIFGELQIPLAEDWTAQIAARYEDYGGNIGSEVTPKFAIRWQALDQLMLRGSVSTSFKAPSLSQINEGTGFGIQVARDVLVEVDDPVNGDQCVRTGRCALPDPTDVSLPVVPFVKEGLPSPGLDPEKAVTWGGGLQWTAQKGPFQDLGIGLDYWRIKYEDKILEQPNQAILNKELDLFRAALAADDFVIVNVSDPLGRPVGTPCDPTDAEFDPGVIGTGESCQVNPAAYALPREVLRRSDITADLQIISGGSINTGEVLTDGVDVSMQWPVNTDNLGNFVFSGNFSWVHQWEAKDFPVGTPEFDAAGYTNRSPERSIAASMPDKKGNFTVNWFRDRHSVTTALRFILNYTDDSAPNVRLERSIDSYYAVDLRYNYRLPVGDSEMTFSVGAIDLFNSDLTNLFDANGFDATVFDGRQRRIYAGLTYNM
jgi:iron complex outermembrane receptor protein